MSDGRNEDWDLLSAYVDGVLRRSEREALEARLQTDPDLRTRLEELRAGIAVLRQTPSLELPRDFRLDPAKHRRSSPWWARYASIQRIGMLGSAAAILLIAAGVLLSVSVSPTTSTMNSGATAALYSATLLAEQEDPAVAMQATAQSTSIARSTGTLLVTPALPMESAATTDGSADAAADQSSEAGAQVEQIATATADTILTLTATRSATTEIAMEAAGAAAPVQPDSTMIAIQTQNAASAANSFAPPAESADVSPQQVTATAAARIFSSSSTAVDTGTPIGTAASPQQPAPSSVPTLSDAAQKTADEGPDVSVQVPLLLIFGIALLVLSMMLAGIGYLRGRIGA